MQEGKFHHINNRNFMTEISTLLLTLNIPESRWYADRSRLGGRGEESVTLR